MHPRTDTTLAQVQAHTLQHVPCRHLTHCCAPDSTTQYPTITFSTFSSHLYTSRTALHVHRVPYHTSLLQHTEQIVSQLVAALSELPEGWTAPQNGPLQVQADFTQLMLDLRR